jgi:hypothetical protein
VGTADEASDAKLETRAKGLVFEDAVLVCLLPSSSAW